MRRRRLTGTVLAAFVLAACGTSKVDLRYAPYNANIAAAVAEVPRIEVASFVDQRGEPSNWLGAIRGGFGNPMKSIESAVPVNQIIARAFADGLQARRYSVGPGKEPGVQLSGVIRKLDCNQYVQREANVEIEVVLTSTTTRKQIFSRSYSATNYERSGLAVGAFGSSEDLRSLLERTLQETIDKALDDPALRNALRGSARAS